jgi:hypothetical protein
MSFTDKSIEHISPQFTHFISPLPLKNYIPSAIILSKLTFLFTGISQTQVSTIDSKGLQKFVNFD